MVPHRLNRTRNIQSLSLFNMNRIAKRLLLMTAILAPMALGAQTKNDLPDFEITGNVRGGLKIVK